MTRRVLRWEVPVDDRPHMIGAGPVIHVDCRPPVAGSVAARVEVWTVETTPPDWPMIDVGLRAVQVFVTGQPLPEEASQHVGSALDGDGALVWHVFYVRK